MLKRDPNAKIITSQCGTRHWYPEDIRPEKGKSSFQAVDGHGNIFADIKPVNHPNPWVLQAGNATQIWEVKSVYFPELEDLVGVNGSLREIVGKIRERLSSP